MLRDFVVFHLLPNSQDLLYSCVQVGLAGDMVAAGRQPIIETLGCHDSLDAYVDCEQGQGNESGVSLLF